MMCSLYNFENICFLLTQKASGVKQSSQAGKIKSMDTIRRRIFLYQHQILALPPTVPDNSDNQPLVRVVTEAWELLTQVTRPNWETALFQLVDLLRAGHWNASSGPSHSQTTGHILSGQLPLENRCPSNASTSTQHLYLTDCTCSIAMVSHLGDYGPGIQSRHIFQPADEVSESGKGSGLNVGPL